MPSEEGKPPRFWFPCRYHNNNRQDLQCIYYSYLIICIFPPSFYPYSVSLTGTAPVLPVLFCNFPPLLSRIRQRQHTVSSPPSSYRAIYPVPAGYRLPEEKGNTEFLLINRYITFPPFCFIQTLQSVLYPLLSCRDSLRMQGPFFLCRSLRKRLKPGPPFRFLR